MFLKFSKIYFYLYALLLVISPMFYPLYPWIDHTIGSKASNQMSGLFNLTVAHLSLIVFGLLTLIMLICALRLEMWVRSWNK